jgi:hypothetical protein
MISANDSIVLTGLIGRVGASNRRPTPKVWQQVHEVWCAGEQRQDQKMGAKGAAHLGVLYYRFEWAA